MGAYSGGRNTGACTWLGGALMAITLPQIVNEIRRLAAETPDFIYKAQGACVYVEKMADHSYRKSCIVGHALVNLGVDPATLDVPPCSSTHLLVERLRIVGPQSPRLRIEWIWEVQFCQDLCMSWGRAVEAADGLIREMGLRAEEAAGV